MVTVDRSEQLRGGAGGIRPRAIAVDFDGTLTEGGRPRQEALDALGRARAAGIATVLVTGRIVRELEAVFPDVAEHFDALVAENGVVLATPAGSRCLGPPIHSALAGALTARGVAHRRGQGILACSAADEHAVVDEVARLGLEAQLVHNRGELMVLPSGLNKGTGLRKALTELGVSPHDTLAVGDAENDHSLLAAAEVGVAVANAVASLKEEAGWVLADRDGPGVVQMMDDILAGRGPWAQAPRRSVVLGTDEAGDQVLLPARPANLLIAGGPGGGKSFLAGLLVEQLVALGYSVLVVDPEGEHAGLGRLESAVVVGGKVPLPPPATVASLLHSGDASVVVDLSGLRPAERARYLLDLPVEVEASRRDTGRPHWVFIDEADALVSHEAVVGAFQPAAHGYCFVTWHPEQLPPETLAAVETVLATVSPHPGHDLVDLTAAVACQPKTAMTALLTGPVGRVVVARRGAASEPQVARLADRTTGHARHEHKYAAGGLSPERRFWFRTQPDRLTGAVAGNLGELKAELAHCERGVLRHHAPRHDLSSWVAHVFLDQELAARIYSAEEDIEPDSPAAIVESGRLAILAALRSRRPG